MTTTLGCEELTYEVVLDWAKLPDGWSFNEEVADVAIDSQDRVYVFNRSEHPMMVFDRQGNFLTSWGEGIFKRPHGITPGPDDTLYCADDGDHTVRKCTLDGRVLMTLGKPGQPAPLQSGRPFNRPTKVAMDPKNGGFYVSDGYGNSRVHKYSPDGKLLFSWGEAGTDPGQFNIVHSVCTDRDGYVYVTDRENHRLQVFDSKGKYVTQWNNMHRACGLHISDGEQQLVYIGELATALAINKDVPNIGPRVSIYTLEGELLVRLGDRNPGSFLNRFWSPHGIVVDSRGDIYTGKASASYTANRPDVPMELRSFRKFVKK
jgi:DNA-binding beta-propeller fold protein YncE